MEKSSLDEALALLHSVYENGCEAATYQEDEQCFFCRAQVNYSAPKRDEDHEPTCIYVQVKRFLAET